ncbi:hypothetical protein C8Q80DRAFT_1265536 [Daedaleopsis nitida]|nr:hypothetical protein C8Q80DRAFT_1265536 [Daedaleopsis nitida]
MHLDLKNSVYALLEIIKNRRRSYRADEAIWELHEPLSQAVLILERTWNERRPLLSLPIEILNKILSQIPDRTPHKFRNIDLSSTPRGGVRQSHTKGQSSTLPIILARSANVPLTIVLTEPQDPIGCVLLDKRQQPEHIRVGIRELLQPEHIVRIRELHMSRMTMDDRQQLYLHFDSSQWTSLEHLTLASPPIANSRDGDALPFKWLSKYMPRLRYLQLEIYILSVTAIGPGKTSRVAGYSPFLFAKLESGAAASTVFFADVHEVWIALAQEYARHPVISALLASIPALQTITLVTDYTRYGDSESSSFSPSFSFAPKSSERGPRSARVRTLRLVHGYGDYEEACRRLRTSGTTPQLEVDEDAVARLRAHVRVVGERIEGIPEPPVPEYCVDPASSGRLVASGSLW